MLQARPGFPLQVIIAGGYEDQFVRDGDGWRFADRLINIQLVGDLHEHLLLDLPE